MTDGAIVFAIRAEEVMLDEHGCKALLWAPDAGEGCDEAAAQERLKHCRLAAKHGRAVGLLVYAEQRGVGAGRSLSLRVKKTGSEYWAMWKTQSRRLEPHEFDSASLRLLESRVAALAAER